jgi:hypothetical protein
MTKRKSIFGTVRDTYIEELKKTSEDYCLAETFINPAVVNCTSPIAARVTSMSNRQLSLEVLFRGASTPLWNKRIDLWRPRRFRVVRSTFRYFCIRIQPSQELTEEQGPCVKTCTFLLGRQKAFEGVSSASMRFLNWESDQRLSYLLLLRSSVFCGIGTPCWIVTSPLHVELDREIVVGEGESFMRVSSLCVSFRTGEC